MPAVSYSGSRADLRALLRKLPAILSGAVGDPYGVARGLQLRLGVALLSKVQQAFLVKSRGGTGDDGIKWAPLKRETIAQRRVGKGDLSAIGIKGASAKGRVRGLLTPAQDKKWRGIFAREKARLMAKFGMAPGAAAGLAAKLAWGILKAEGAQTKLQVLGGRTVDIGRDTGRLLMSFSPGVEDRPSGEAEQVFQAPPGKVIVGTTVPYAEAFHRRRPFWPSALPPAWRNALLGTYRRGLARVVALIVSQGARP